MNKRKLTGLFLIALFVPVALFIGFFHTEKTPGPNPNCPACQFQLSSIATCEIQAAVVPQIHLLEDLAVLEFILEHRIFARDLLSRGPPLG